MLKFTNREIKSKNRIYIMRYFIQTILLMTIILTGCQSDFGVKKASMENWVKERAATALTSEELSHNTKDFLLREGLDEQYTLNPKKTLEQLSATLLETRDRKLLYYLTELTYLEAKRCSNPDEKNYYYLSACIYSYAYLFKKDFNEDPSPYEPEFLFACRLYNYSATKVFQYLRNKKLLNSSDLNLPFLNGAVRLKPLLNKLPYKLEQFSSIEICYNYETFGFHTLTRQSGLGIPLIASGDIKKIKRQHDETGDIIDISKVAYPATAFIRFFKEGTGKYTAEVELYDPMDTDSITVNNKTIPLEEDISTYLGWILRGGPNYSPVTAMMDTKNMEGSEGLYILTPYEKNKIPVVFIHGVLSYPRTWVQTINTLLMDPTIRKRYQFWLFAYPTGNPILYSAAKLRRDLLKAQRKYDPNSQNKNFNQMVLIGHSMGGLLTKVMVQNSKDILLNALTKGKPLSSFDLTKKEENFIKETLVYKPLPFVKRVIFISVPHRGSTMTRWWLADLAAKLVNLPEKLADKIQNIQHKLLVQTGIKKAGNSIKISTGVDNLDPENSFIKLSSKIPISKNVKYHSIIGNNEKAGIPGGTDGIVDYSSSHLDGAESELIVHSGHSAHKKSLAIQEIKRILLKHLKDHE